MPTGLNSLAFDDDVKCGRIKIVIHRYEEWPLITSTNSAFDVARAENLTKKDINGKADPYVVVTYENQRYETKV